MSRSTTLFDKLAEPTPGLEPGTGGLQNHCSTVELGRRASSEKSRGLRPGRLSREPRAHVGLVLVMEMRKERSAAHRRALHPRKASGVVERGLRKFLDRRRELLKDATRLR